MEIHAGEIWQEKTRFDCWQVLSVSEERIQVRGVYVRNIGFETSIPRDFFEAELYKLSEDNFVKFWGANNTHGVFSNFSAHPIFVNGKMWKTNEHFYQAQKFAGTEAEEIIRSLKTPSQAFYESRNPKHQLRADWEAVKEQVMYTGLKAKFTQHQALKTILLDTGDKYLVEDSPKDFYWGWGKDRTGKNRLGHLLMQLRAELKQSESDNV